MYFKELLQPADLQPFINQPETLINQTLEIQLAIANYLQTPIEILEKLVNQSSYSQVVEAAKLHVTYIESTGEVIENWEEIAEERIKNAPLRQNDRLVAELLKIAPVPEYLISEWMPGHILIQGLENPYLPKKDKVKILERLGKSTIIEERLTAAAHPDTPRETLEILAGDVELPIRIAVKYRDDSPDDVIEIIESQYEVASDWETLALELTELGGSKWSWIRQTVARNFNAPVEVLRELTGDGEERVQLAIARNLAAPGEVLELLVNHSWGEVTESIAKHPNAGEDALVKLLSQHHFCIYQRPNLTPKTIAELLKYEEENSDRYRNLVINNPNSPGNALAQVINSPYYQRENIASHPNVLVNSLKQLAQDSSVLVRLAVYQNAKTPENLRNQLLEEFLNLDRNQVLFQDDYGKKVTSDDTWKGVAQSGNTSASVLERLASLVDLDSETSLKKNIGIAIALIGNSNTPVVTRNKLTEELQSISNSQQNKLYWEICLALAFNSSVPENQREEYFQQVIDNNSEGCKYLAQNPKTPSHILEKLYEMGFKCEIAGNQNTPPSILAILAKDRSLVIRRKALRNPSITSEIIVELINSENPEYTPKRVARVEYKNYDEWSEFWFQYPSISAIDLYRILLPKAVAEENNNFQKFIVNNYSRIYQFKVYLANSEDKNYIISLASSSDTPIHILEKLAEDDDVNVRIALAKSNNTPLHILLALSKDSDTRVRRELLKYNQKTPVEILEILKSDESEEIRNFIANSHNTPPEILNYLSNDSSTEVKQNIADNPNTPLEIIEKLWREDKVFSSSNHNTPSYIVGEKIAETGDSETLHKILKGSLKTYPQISSDVLEKLASHQDDSVRSQVAVHPNTPVHILEVLADDNYKFTRFYLAKNPNTPPHVLEKLFNIWKFDEEEYNNELSFLAGNPNSPPTVLDSLSNYRHFFIRAELLKNPNLPISVVEKLLLKGEQIDSNLSNILVNHPTSNYEIVEKLLQSSNLEIRRNAIYTPHVTSEQWIKLACDESSEIRETVAGSSNSSTSIHTPSLSIIIEHPNLPLEIWEELAKDSIVEVREALTYNLNLPEKIIELLALDESSEVRERLINFKNIPFRLLEILSRDISPNVRKAVAEHPNTSINLLEQLALDSDVGISQAIIDNPNTPFNLKETLLPRLRVKLKGTLKGLTRLYNSKTDDLPTLLSEYVQSSVPFVRFISSIHPLIPTEFLHQYSQSLLWWERYAVAINSATSFKIREKLTEDCNFLVKAAAEDNL